jgi:hypothetical protein
MILGYTTSVILRTVPSLTLEAEANEDGDEGDEGDKGNEGDDGDDSSGDNDGWDTLFIEDDDNEAMADISVLTK